MSLIKILILTASYQGMIYFTVPKEKAIYNMTSRPGSIPHKVIIPGNTSPKLDLAINPATKQIIWTQKHQVFAWQYGSRSKPSKIFEAYVSRRDKPKLVLQIDSVNSVVFIGYSKSIGGLIKSVDLRDPSLGSNTIVGSTKGHLDFSWDSFHRIMYWLDDNRIKKKDMHGNETIVYHNFTSTSKKTGTNYQDITGLTVDARNGYIYFSEKTQSESRIISVREDGMTTEVYKTLEDIDQLTYSDYLYWIEPFKSNDPATFLPIKEYKINRMRVGNNKEQPILMYKTRSEIAGLAVGGIGENAADLETCTGSITSCVGIERYPRCLTKGMLCNNVPECYDGLDEFYCCNNNPECGIRDIEIYCRESKGEEKLLVDLKSDFLDWTNHPFSNIFEQNSILTLRCSLKGSYFDSNSVQRKIDINDLHEMHVFRQFVGPGVFRNVQYARKLLLVGIRNISKFDKDTFQWYQSLTHLSITDTTLKHIDWYAFSRLRRLKVLELTKSPYLRSLHGDVFKGLQNLTVLNISSNSLVELKSGTFHDLNLLDVIDLRGNNLRITHDLFEYNEILTKLYADSYAFCCLKPKSVTDDNCITPKHVDTTTSCDDLIKEGVLRVFLWIIGILAVVGNLIVIVYHFVGKKDSKTGTFTLFVVNLSVSDAMMGFYMIIIGIHDAMFLGEYVWKDHNWRNSILCKITGALAYVSSESSVIFIFFITLERFLASRFPNRQYKITPNCAYIIISIAWVVSVFSAVLPGILYEGFYSISGVCVALPLTGGVEEGRFNYSASVFLGFNFVVFAFIALGQYLIFREIRVSSKRVRSSLTSNEKRVAKLLLMIALTDCLCWLPIGTLVILAICGVKIPDVMYAWVVVFILPGNSAINPFLYTFAPALLKKRREFMAKSENSKTRGTNVNTTDVCTKESSTQV